MKARIIFTLTLALALGAVAVTEAACRNGRCAGKKPVRSFIGRLIGR